MVLIAESICLKIPQTGLRMFMYDFSSQPSPQPISFLLPAFLVSDVYRCKTDMSRAHELSDLFHILQDTLFDEFVLAHIFGWWGKAIMFRNQPLLWVLSIGFELMEVSDLIYIQFITCEWS